MNECRTITLFDSEFCVYYKTKRMKRFRTAYFRKERYDIVRRNLGKGFINLSYKGKPSKDIKIENFRMYQAITPLMQFVGKR